MIYTDGSMFDTGISVAPKCTRVRVIGEEYSMYGSRDKFWLKAVPVCNEVLENHGDGRQCNGCTCRCGKRELFIKFYTGSEEEILKSMENQGKHSPASPYIARTFGCRKNDRGTYVVMEYVNGVTLEELPGALQEARIYPEEREYVLAKYRLIRQMLLCVKDYQKQSGTGGAGVHLDLKPENFIIHRMGRDRQMQIKLVDFEGYTKTNGSMDAFVYSAGYAHPKQIECFLRGNVPIQAEVTWDFYALGAIIYEMLEEAPFFTEQEMKIRKEKPFAVKKEPVFQKFLKAVPPEEEKRIRYMIHKMMDPENPWSNIEIIIQYFQELLDDCLTSAETECLTGKEYLRTEEKLLGKLPYLRIGVEVRSCGYPSVYQSYDLLRGSVIPLYYGINIQGSGENSVELLGYLYECEGNAYYFPVKDGKDWPETGKALKRSDLIQMGSAELEFLRIERKGYPARDEVYRYSRNI